MRRIADAVAAGRFHVDVGDLNAPPPPRAPLHAAIAEGKNAMVRFLMAMGASVVKGDGDAATPTTSPGPGAVAQVSSQSHLV